MLLCRRAVLLNLKYNETIATFANAAGVGSGDKLRASATKAKPAGGACTCIAFRTGETSSLFCTADAWCFRCCCSVHYDQQESDLMIILELAAWLHCQATWQCCSTAA